MHELEKLKKIICIKDNDEDDRMLLHEALLTMDQPFEIQEFSSAEQLMELCGKPDHRSDYIFLDLLMLGMDGFKCITELRRLRGAVGKIIIYTIDSKKESMEKAFLLGADFYAVKPHTFEDLKDMTALIMQGGWENLQQVQRIFHIL
ncbi:response regulator [Flavobacterium sp.]|uniref:response regulator n=1 Tax=Flavobacterium sp. TaxID=239 RepID=UPI0031D46479